MELLLLDKDFNELVTIDIFSSLQWTRKYYDVGSFSLECEVKYFSVIDEAKYIYRTDRKQLGVIQSVTLDRTQENDNRLSCSGDFVECLLFDRIVLEKNTYEGTHEFIARQLVEQNLISPGDSYRKFDYLEFGIVNNLGENTSLELEYENLDIYDFLKDAELSYKIEYDYIRNKLVFSIYQGLDRTDSQDVNDWAIFSDNLETIASVEYNKDITEAYNHIYVIGKDGNYQWYSGHESNDRKETSVKMTNEVDNQKLIDKGSQTYAKYQKIEKISGVIVGNDNLEYLKDFDLGDKVVIGMANLNKAIEVRITQIKEVYEQGQYTLDIGFGNDYLTARKLIEREIRK